MLCVAKMIERIRTLDPAHSTTHLISIGGWNAPHPDSTYSATDVYNAWHKWNTETIISAKHGFYGNYRFGFIHYESVLQITLLIIFPSFLRKNILSITLPLLLPLPHTGFDGFDWDIEGNDDEDSPFNTFKVGKFSSVDLNYVEYKSTVE